MEIYLFVSNSSQSVSGFTSDVTGSKLPAEYAPWDASEHGEAVRVGSATDPVSMMIQRHGYFLVSTRKRITSRVA